MTLAQMRTSLQAKGYGTDTATAQTELLNSAYRAVLGHRRWPFLEKASTSLTTTAGTVAVAVTSVTDLLWIDAVRIEYGTRYEPLEWMPPQEFRDYEHEFRVNAVPTYWTFINGELRFHPRPDQAYTITLDYIKLPATYPLSGDSDTPLGASVFHDVYVWGAAKEIAYRERDWNAYNVAKTEYDERLREMTQEYGVTQRQTARRVVNTNRRWRDWNERHWDV